MFKTLLKKQFMEVMNFNRDRKDKNKTNSKKANIIVWIVAMAIVFVAMGALALGIGTTLIKSGYSWAYFTLMGCLSIFFGTFGSVFNTYHALYLSKDNDLLLSMPIKPEAILASRILIVYFLSLLYSASVWVPSVIIFFILGKVTFASCVYSLLLTLIIAVFVSSLTCIIGALIAYLSIKLKKNKIITIILSLGLIAGLYYIQFNLMELMNTIVSNIDVFSAFVKKWLALLYYLGMAADGNHLEMLLFCVIVAALFAIIYIILSKTFIKLATTSISVKKTEYKEKKSKKVPVIQALIMKEAKGFYSLTAYLLNAGLGLFIAIVIGIVFLAQSQSMAQLFAELNAARPGLIGMKSIVAATVMCVILGMDAITAPSISLEAKTLWMLRSMPIKEKDVLLSKVMFSIIYNTIAIVICGIMLAIALKLNIIETLLTMAVAVAFVSITAYSGLLLNLKMPNFKWTTQIVPIKQSAPVVISVFGAMFLGIIIFVPYMFIAAKLSSSIYLLIVLVLLTALCIALDKALKTKGVEMFNKL